MKMPVGTDHFLSIPILIYFKPLLSCFAYQTFPEHFSSSPVVSVPSITVFHSFPIRTFRYNNRNINTFLVRREFVMAQFFERECISRSNLYAGGVKEAIRHFLCIPQILISCYSRKMHFPLC